MADREIIVALDFPSPAQALAFADTIAESRCAVKVGFELFVAGGPQLVEQLLAKNLRVFLDLKFHDIPNTVAKACAVASQLGVWMLNVHAAGGTQMLMAAAEAIEKCNLATKPVLIAVTVLTSLDQTALAEVGISQDVPSLVLKWSRLAKECGLDGVVSSAREASLIRENLDDDFVIVTPGIRLSDKSTDDQKRVVTPADARAAGASHIVVGRPITQAADPMQALALFRNAFAGA
jgi:orotidine-5'-phosphate decarboxylase